ncbi:MAG: energy transducer TonB [Ferruginibacter sp.]
MQKIVLALLCCLAFSKHGITQHLPMADTIVYTKVSVEASFPGGDEAWREYLMKNLKANVPVKKKAPAGIYRVVVKFIVSKDGTLTGIEAETAHGYGMEEEVIRIIKKGPNWTPALIDKKPVNAYRRQPVTFAVEEK